MDRSVSMAAFAVLSFFAAAAPAFCQSGQTLKRTVKKDVETRIVTHANATKPYPGQFSCAQGGPVTIEIVKPPLLQRAERHRHLLQAEARLHRKRHVLVQSHRPGCSRGQQGGRSPGRSSRHH